ANPELSASRLIGQDVTPVTEDGSPRAGLTVGLWEPGTRTRVDGRGPGFVTAGPEQGRDGEPGAGEADDATDGADGPRRRSGSEEPLRRSATSEAGALLADLVERDVQTLVFARSRRGAEL